MTVAHLAATSSGPSPGGGTETPVGGVVAAVAVALLIVAIIIVCFVQRHRCHQNEAGIPEPGRLPFHDWWCTVHNAIGYCNSAYCAIL